MKRFMLALTLCFLLGSFYTPALDLTAAPTGHQQRVVAITQEPVNVNDDNVAKLVVEGPTKVKVGELVVISVEKSRAASFKWIVLPSTDNFLVIDEGKRIVFSSGAGGEFKFFISCSLENTCDSHVHTVTVAGGTPQVTDSLPSKIALWCEPVDSATKRDDCLRLATAFSSVAMVMDGGTLTTPTEIVEATFKATRDALGDNLEDWLPFRQSLANELRSMAQSGQLTDTASHIRVWKVIAATLREYAETL